MQHHPKIAIIGQHVLENIGLQGLLEKIIPFAHIEMLPSPPIVDMEQQEYFHYFVFEELLKLHPDFFKTMVRKTIVLTRSNTPCPPFHHININVDMQELLKQFLILEQMVHHDREHFPPNIARELQEHEEKKESLLTPREIEILKDIAKGKSSKEIAEELHISLSTVLSHRKNIMTKTQAHSATKLVIYAVHHHYISAEDIHLS